MRRLRGVSGGRWHGAVGAPITLAPWEGARAALQPRSRVQRAREARCWRRAGERWRINQLHGHAGRTKGAGQSHGCRCGLVPVGPVGALTASAASGAPCALSDPRPEAPPATSATRALLASVPQDVRARDEITLPVPFQIAGIPRVQHPGLGYFTLYRRRTRSRSSVAVMEPRA